MDKKLLFSFFLIVLNVLGISQAPYGVEWIEASLPHYKFGIVEDKVYRIDFQTLQSFCPEILSAPVNQICLYNLGKKVPIYVSWTNSPTNNDYIEFYGVKLDGTIDNLLYNSPNENLNPLVSLVKDTNYYYLTLRTSDNHHISFINNDTTTVTSPYLTECFKVYQKGFSDNYSGGKRFYYGSGTWDFITASPYQIGEGWGTTSYTDNSILLESPNSSSSNPSNLELRIFGGQVITHKLEYKLNTNSIGIDEFIGSSQSNFTKTFQSSWLNSSSNLLKINALNPVNDPYYLGYLKITYPALINFSDSKINTFYLPPFLQKQKIAFSNYSAGSNMVRIMDVKNEKLIEHPPANTIRFALPASIDTPRFVLYHLGLLNKVNSLTKVNFNLATTLNSNFVIITDNSLRFDSSNLNVLEDYKAFKTSAQGGGHNVNIVYINDLIDLFGYGIPKHPIAIRKFLQYIQVLYNNPVKNVLLIGKGYSIDVMKKSSSTQFQNSKIPSFGTPSSDYLYPTWDSSLIKHTSIGRLSITHGQELRNYLNKYKEYTTASQDIDPANQTPAKKEYMKWLIHMGGGQSTDEQSIFRNNLKEFEKLAVDTSYGTKVFSVFKNGPDNSQDANSVDLVSRINKGVSLITFFGHSSSTIFDVGIGDPNTFTNLGKYPIFLANGCNAGNFYSETKSSSEQFISLPNSGSVGFISTTYFALNTALYNFSKAFYNKMLKTNYGATIGDLMNLSAKEMLSNGPLNYNNTVAMDYNLNGDPSIYLNQYSLPDYYIDPTFVRLNKNFVNTSIDSIELFITVQNLGKAVDQNLQVTITRKNGTASHNYEYIVKAPYFKDTYSFKLPTIEDALGVGSNEFYIKIDADNSLSEITHQNNGTNSPVNLYIENDDAIPIYPFDFSIINNSSPTLISSTTLSTPSLHGYTYQIDTTEFFNSPRLQSIHIQTNENVVKWRPVVAYRDSTVYYWRIRKDSTSQKTYPWYNSSFIYLASAQSDGWNQSHYYQFLKNSFSNITLPPSRKLEYISDVKSIKAVTDGSSSTYGVEWYLNNVRAAAFREAGRISNGIFVIWIDGVTGLVHNSIDTTINGGTFGAYGSVRFGYPNAPRAGFVFQDTGYTPANHPSPNTKWSDVIVNFFNQVPNNDYLIIYTLKKPVYESWDPSLVSLFKNAGFSQIDNFVNKTIVAPFVFGYQKNNSSFPPKAYLGTDYTSKTTGEYFIKGYWKLGYEYSVKIGPTTQWNKLQYRISSIETPSNDNNLVTLYGINSSNQKIPLWSSSQNTVDTAINWISASTYPNLSLTYFSQDSISRSPGQLDYWRIYYKDIPEISVLSESQLLSRSLDTIENGQEYVLNLGAETLTSSSFDSLSLKVILSHDGQQKISYYKLKPLAGNSSDSFKIAFPYTNYFEGENQVLYQINPPDYFYQPEKYEYNNFGHKRFYVKSDNYNPFLDVTFDGVRILNNELVSNNPTIQIKLKDESKYLLLNDTALIKIFLKQPNGISQPVYFSNPNVSYTLASSASDNVISILYQPTLIDGSYQLIVKDADKSNNSSSQNRNFDYKISFNIISRKQISQVFNYPNPFTTSTQFVFTLTGKVPDQFKIQIINIRGQVVKEIFKEDLGTLRVGLNKTDYRWDGKDQFGSELANGVYLYKVTAKDDSGEYPMMDPGDFQRLNPTTQDINKYFKDGWGKLVILR